MARLAAALFAALAAGHAGAADPPRKPNVVLVMVDDMGYADLGCYGGDVRTPNIDALAAAGTRWRSFYNCSQCCPTRASLMTGLYPHQAGVGDMIDDHSKATREAAASPAYSDRLAPNAVTIAEALKPAGYRTYMVGKWHLGKGDGQRPLHRGFDRYYGIIAGADSYWKPASLRDDDRPVGDVPPGFYATDAFTDKAIEFVESGGRDEPFFLYVAYNAPHTPYHAKPADIERYKGAYDAGWDAVRNRRFARQKELGLWPAGLALPPRDPLAEPWTGTADQRKMADRMGVYAAILDNVDQNVGRLTAALKRRGIEDRTLVLFLSDNGAWASKSTYGLEWAETGNTPYRLFKVFTHEGGVCTPFIARWPGTIPAGVLNTTRYGHVKDVFATCLDAAGAPRPTERAGAPVVPTEGNSLLPALRDPTLADNEPLYWERRGHGAMRDGRWKIARYYGPPGKDLLQVSEGPRVGRWELYDLAADPVEATDLAAREPDRLRQMVARYEAWGDRVGVIDRERIAGKITAGKK